MAAGGQDYQLLVAALSNPTFASGNFLAVHRVRLQDDEDEDGHSSDMASDEELEVSNADIQAALQTRIGGQAQTDAACDEDPSEASARKSHYAIFSSGVELAQHVWGDCTPGTVEPKFSQIRDAKKVLQARNGKIPCHQCDL